MRKISFALVLLMLLSICSASIAVAREDTIERVIFQAEEITDSEVLYERAKLGITDLEEQINNGKQIYNFAQKVGSDEKDINVKSRIYSTTQLLKETVIDGEEITSYVTTLFIDTKFPEEENPINQTRLSLSATDDKNDPSISVKIWCTIYWNSGTMYWPTNGNYVDYVQYYSAKTSWQIIDSSVSISNFIIRAKSTGFNYDTNKTEDSEYRYSYPSSPSGATFSTYFDRYNPIWGCEFYNRGQCYCTRGGSNWWFSAEFQVSFFAGNMMFFWN